MTDAERKASLKKLRAIAAESESEAEFREKMNALPAAFWKALQDDLAELDTRLEKQDPWDPGPKPGQV